MTQILPAAPAPAPSVGPTGTAVGATNGASSGTSSDATATDEFLAILAHALGEVVDAEATMEAVAVDEEASEAEPLICDLSLTDLVDALAGAALAEAGAVNGDEVAPVDDGEVVVDAVEGVDEGTVDQAGESVDGDLGALPGLDQSEAAVDASGPPLGPDGVEDPKAAADPAGPVEGAAPSGAPDDEPVVADPRAEALARAEADAWANLTIPDWIIAQHQAQLEEQALRTGARTPATAGVDATSAASTAPAPVAPAEAAGVTPPGTVDPALLDGDDPWQQLATVIRPLRQLADGTHRLSLQLRPAELGTVHLEVAVEDGQLSVRAVAESIATRDVLVAAMDDLRSELVRSGIDVGSLDVGEHTSGGATSDQSSLAFAAAPSLSAMPGPDAGSTAPSLVTSDSTPAFGSLPGRLDLSL